MSGSDDMTIKLWKISGSLDFTVKLWNKKTGKLIRTFEAHSDSVNSVYFESW